MLRRLLLLLLALSLVAAGQPLPLPPPPPEVPEPIPGESAPFDPEKTQEAPVKPGLKLTLPAASEELPERPLTILQAIVTAWERQPDVLEARGRLRQAEGAVVQQRANILPTLSLNSTYSHVTTNSAPGGGGGNTVIVGNQVLGGGGGASNTTDRLSTRVGFDQLLFDFGRTRNLILQADLQRQSAAADLLAAKNDAALSVKENLYRYIQARRLVRVREEDLENRRQQLRLARALYDAGEMSAGDVVRAQSAVTNSVVSLNSARLDFENARQTLVLSVGLPPMSPVEFEDFSEPQLAERELAVLLERALSQRPDLISARREVEARKAGLGAAYAFNRPQVNAFTGVTYQGQLDAVQVPTLTAQLLFSFDFYDGGARAGAVTSAEGLLQISQANLQRTRLEVERLVGSVLARLLTAERNVEAAKAGVASAREGVRIAEGRYRVGLGTLTDVLVAQSDYVQAQTNLQDSYAELFVSRARLRHALAAPLEEGFESGP